jgi:two-component system, cell cycle sensor histidine kinase and response regulator CckA
VAGYTAYLQLMSPAHGNSIRLANILLICVSLAAVVVTLLLLARGHLEAGTHLVLTALGLALWFIIVPDRSETTSRLDTITFVFALMAFTPLLVARTRFMVIVFGVVNLSAIWIYMFTVGRTLGLPLPAFWDFLADTTAAFVAATLAAYGTISLNARALQKTEELNAELRVSEQKYRSVVENVSEAIVVAQDGRLRFVNTAATAIAGFPEEELLERPFSDLVHPEDRQRVEEAYERRTRGAPLADRFIFRIVTATGRVLTMETAAAMVEWEGKPAVLNVLSDVTERRQTEEALQNLQKLESLGTLAGGIAHDFNNQLTGVLGNVSLVLESLREGDENRQMLAEAQEACLVARSLANQLQSLAAGGTRSVRVVDLRPLVAEQCAFAVRGTNTRCRCDLGDQPLRAAVDPQQFRQVVQNLVLNAVQAMPSGGSIGVRAGVETTGDGGAPGSGRRIRIDFEDTGTGMSPDVLRRVFDPFFSTKAQGRGLGLTMCHSIVTRLGGAMTVRSEPGRGTTFTVNLPESTGAGGSVSAETEPIAGGRGRVLVMDDEPAVSQVLSAMLRRLGYRTKTVIDGAQAIDAYREARQEGAVFDLVIMDMTIPGGMGGREALAELRRFDPSVRAVASSGYTTATDFEAQGFLGVLAKPYTLKELSAILRAAAPGKGGGRDAGG